MSDSYIELLVRQRTGNIVKAIRVVVIALAVACLIFGLFGAPTMFLAGMVLGVVGYLLYLNTELEFEYLFMSKELTVDRIKAKSRRKRVMEFDMQRVEIVAPENSHRLDSYKNRNMKVMNFSTGNPGEIPYVMIYNGGQEMVKVKLEPNPDLTKCFEMTIPRKIFKD